jgi:endonuclease III
VVAKTAASGPAPDLDAVLARLDERYPAPRTALDHENPLQLLVATILSAQCQDSRVNQVTPALFAAHPTSAALAAVPSAELEAAIHSTGFFRAKAKTIKAACKLLVARHGGEVPRTMPELLELPGVARKTANVVLGSGFGIASGIVVDTHVKRVAARLGLTAQEDPEKIERDLLELVPEARWIRFSLQMVLHGRETCVARKPRCGECVLAALCPSAEKPEGPA